MAFSSSSAFTGNDANRQRKKKKTIQDRTQEEGIELVKDLIRAAVEAGPRAGPARTLQAYRAVALTAQEFLRPGASMSNIELPAVVRALFERMGATYVKLGQFIASSPTLFPAEYVVSLVNFLFYSTYLTDKLDCLVGSSGLPVDVAAL